ncbi:MAG TPA: glycosyltransferase family 9 protein [Chloroflexota bacterium]|nr:glycosyltransferase family 9 protein [Chloroflexota bacterium]
MGSGRARERAITAAARTLGAFTGRLASRQNTLPPPSPRIVLVRRCCLGDVLQLTPLLHVLRRRYAANTIDVATSAWSAPALSGNPHLSSVVPPTVSALRAGRYDVAMVLERSPVAGMLAWAARIPIRVGLNSEGRGFAHNLRVACPPGRSEASLYLDCARSLDVPADGARATFCPSEADSEGARALLAEHRLGPGFAALGPGGAVNPGMTLLAKRWPASRFAELARRLAQATGSPVALLGGETDVEACAEVQRLAGEAAVDLAGRTSFSESGAIVQAARLLLGNDSSLLHLAAAVGTPFVGVYGPSDPVRHQPWGVGEQVCAPIPRACYENGFSQLDCIGQVTVAMVWAACERVLATSVASHEP